MANYVPYVTSSAGSTKNKPSSNPYGTQTSSSHDPYGSAYGQQSSNAYGAPSSSTSSTMPDSSDYDPYAKYDTIASATTTTTTTTSSYPNSYPTTTSSTSSGYNAYGNAIANNSSATPASDYDPYAKYDNTPSATTSTTMQAPSSSAASSGYDVYGNNAVNNTSTVPASDYDPYAKYGNIPSAPTAPAAGTIPTAVAAAGVTSSSMSSADGFASGFQNPGGSVPPPTPATGFGTATVVSPQKQPLCIQVTIPEGVSSGQTIEVRAPDGRAKQVVVPPGLGPGSSLTVDFDNNNPSSTVAPGKPNKSSLEAKATKTMNSLVQKMGKMGIKVPGVTSNSSASASQPVHSAPIQTPNVSVGSVSNSHFAPIAPQHATSQPAELYLKEKTMSWTGDDAKIKDASDNVIFKIKAELLTFSQSRTLTDAQGNVLGLLRHKKLDFAPTIYIGTPANDKKVSIKTTGMFNPLNCNASISVDGVKVGKAKGNWRAKTFSITIDGVEVATIGRKTTMASMFMDADSYRISITPQGQPVDIAFIALICIALDELYHDK